jgi:filamentous hemagglutinin
LDTKGTGTVAIASGADTTLKDAVLSGTTVIANVGGDLWIESLPDTAAYDAKYNSASVSLGTSGVSDGGSTSKITGDFANVSEQSGIVAGSGGYHIALARYAAAHPAGSVICGTSMKSSFRSGARSIGCGAP